MELKIFHSVMHGYHWTPLRMVGLPVPDQLAFYDFFYVVNRRLKKSAWTRTLLGVVAELYS